MYTLHIKPQDVFTRDKKYIYRKYDYNYLNLMYNYLLIRNLTMDTPRNNQESKMYIKHLLLNDK